MGGESPELAESLLQTGQYIPRSAQDMWSFGLVMLEVLGGQRPLEHTNLLLSSQFQAEVEATGRSKTQLEYLAKLPLEDVPYADQVGMCNICSVLLTLGPPESQATSLLCHALQH